MEFKKAGYKIGVPYQVEPWCICDCGPSKFVKYEDYRALFCEEYAEPIIEVNRELCVLKMICKIKERQMQSALPDLLKIEGRTFEALQKRIMQCKFFQMCLEEGVALDELTDEMNNIAERESDAIDDYLIIAQVACRKLDGVIQKLSELLEIIYGKK